jgi:hypothetical protein
MLMADSDDNSTPNAPRFAAVRFGAAEPLPWWYRNAGAELCDRERTGRFIAPCDREASGKPLCQKQHTIMPVKPASGYMRQPNVCSTCKQDGHWASACPKDMPAGAGYNGWSAVAPTPTTIRRPATQPPTKSSPTLAPAASEPSRSTQPIESRLDLPTKSSSPSSSRASPPQRTRRVEERLDPAARSIESRLALPKPPVENRLKPRESDSTVALEDPGYQSAPDIVWWYRNEGMRKCMFEKDDKPCDKEARTGKFCAFNHTVMPVEPLHGYSECPGPCKHCGIDTHWSNSEMCPAFMNGRSEPGSLDDNDDNDDGEEGEEQHDDSNSDSDDSDDDNDDDDDDGGGGGSGGGGGGGGGSEGIPWWIRNDDAPACRFERKMGECDKTYERGKRCVFRHRVMPRGAVTCRDKYGEKLRAFEDPGPCRRCGGLSHLWQNCTHDSSGSGRRERTVSLSAPDRRVRASTHLSSV